MSVIAILAIIAVMAWAITVDVQRRHRPATIIDRAYAPASTGVGVSSSGKTVTTFEPEHWTLVVRDDDGNVYSISVHADEWAAAKPGQRINDQDVERSGK